MVGMEFTRLFQEGAEGHARITVHPTPNSGLHTFGPIWFVEGAFPVSFYGLIDEINDGGGVVDRFAVSCRDGLEGHIESVIEDFFLVWASHRRDEETHGGEVFHFGGVSTSAKGGGHDDVNGFVLGAVAVDKALIGSFFADLAFEIADDLVEHDENVRGDGDQLIGEFSSNDLTELVEIGVWDGLAGERADGASMRGDELAPDGESLQSAFCPMDDALEQEPIQNGAAFAGVSNVVRGGDSGMKRGGFDLRTVEELALIHDAVEGSEDEVVGVEQFVQKGEVGADDVAIEIVNVGSAFKLLEVKTADELPYGRGTGELERKRGLSVLELSENASCEA